MADINWDEIIAKAKTDTDNKFKNRISSLTSLTNNDIGALLDDSKIKPENFAEVLKLIHDSTLSNENKSKAIGNLSKGIELLVGIAKKLL